MMSGTLGRRRQIGCTPRLLRIWSRLLETSDLSIDDDFFDKGGNSLLATELMLELRKLTGKALPDSLAVRKLYGQSARSRGSARRRLRGRR